MLPIFGVAAPFDKRVKAEINARSLFVGDLPDDYGDGWGLQYNSALYYRSQ